jgi:hypothetical protein
METQDWYKNWYRRMYEIYNSGWDQFMREYVFSEDPPFIIKERPSRTLGDKDSQNKA